MASLHFSFKNTFILNLLFCVLLLLPTFGINSLICSCCFPNCACCSTITFFNSLLSFINFIIKSFDNIN